MIMKRLGTIFLLLALVAILVMFILEDMIDRVYFDITRGLFVFFMICGIPLSIFAKSLDHKSKKSRIIYLIISSIYIIIIIFFFIKEIEALTQLSDIRKEISSLRELRDQATDLVLKDEIISQINILRDEKNEFHRKSSFLRMFFLISMISYNATLLLLEKYLKKNNDDAIQNT